MSSETHESRTNPEARLMWKEKEAKLVFMRYALMENRNMLLMDFKSAARQARRSVMP